MTDTTTQTIEHIVSSPGVRGGKPRVANTRITVGDIAVETSHGLNPAQLAERFDLTLGQVHAALSYYYDHREAIDRQLQDSADYVEALISEQEAGRDTRYISVRMAANELDKSEAWVRRLCQQGRLPAKKVGRAWLIRLEDLDAVRDLKPGYPAGRPRS